jgi:hypothetical protein
MVEPRSPAPRLADAFGPCARGSLDEVPTFDLGFDLAASRAAGAISGVEPGGPAFRAGLRDGQRISGRVSVHNQAPDKLVIVTIADQDGSKVIEYYPRGTSIKVTQYHLDQKAYADQSGTCATKK